MDVMRHNVEIEPIFRRLQFENFEKKPQERKELAKTKWMIYGDTISHDAS